MISVRHQVFLEVARQNSFSRAAATLFISQPAISRHIRALEQEYKCRLFDRNGIRIRLTNAGNLLLNRLKQVSHIEQDTVFEITTLSSSEKATGILRLGASTTVALYILPKVLSRFHHDYPNLEITLLNRNSEIVVDALLQQEINLGIVEGKGKLSGISYQPFMRDQVIAVCSPASTAVSRKPRALTDLSKFTVALREQGSGTLAALEAALKKNKTSISDLNVKLRLGGTEALKNFLVESECIGFLPRRSVSRELANGELVELKFRELVIERDFYFIQRKGESSQMVTRFIRYAREKYNV